MNILSDVRAAEPVGAAALLERGDPAELERFRFLEDRVWDATTLPATVVEAVRVRSARIRGCAFCASVRMSGAAEAGLSEQQLADQDSPATRAQLPEDQRAALRLVDAHLLEAATPSPDEQRWLVDVLGAAGVVEVLVACAVFASADLRIALGDNRAANSAVIERAHARRPRDTSASASAWPSPTGPIVLPGTPVPHVDERIDAALRGLRADLLAQTDLPGTVLAAGLVRCAQLLGADDERSLLLAPEALRAGRTDDEVRGWTGHLTGDERAVMAFAEQLWIDPSGLDEPLVAPLRTMLGDAALIRSTWRLIWIAQLQRIGMVLGPGGHA